MKRQSPARARADSEPSSAAQFRTPAKGGRARIWSAPKRFFRLLVRGPAHKKAEPDSRVSAMGTDARLNSAKRALGSDDASARLMALEVIVGFSEERAAGLLAAAIHDPDRAVSRAAMVAAGRLRAERAVSSLILALDTDDAEQRADVLEALEQITGRTVDPEDVEDPELRAQTVASLQTWWKQERVERLAASLGS